MWYRVGFRVYSRARADDVRTWDAAELSSTNCNNVSGYDIVDEMWR